MFYEVHATYVSDRMKVINARFILESGTDYRCAI
jgi:hypothetical protein